MPSEESMAQKERSMESKMERSFDEERARLAGGSSICPFSSICIALAHHTTDLY
jgi:hypothetical protein